MAARTKVDDAGVPAEIGTRPDDAEPGVQLDGQGLAPVAIVVTAGTLEGGGKRYTVGDTLAVPPAEAERLIGKGVAERTAPGEGTS